MHGNRGTVALLMHSFLKNKADGNFNVLNGVRGAN